MSTYAYTLVMLCVAPRSACVRQGARGTRDSAREIPDKRSSSLDRRKRELCYHQRRGFVRWGFAAVAASEASVAAEGSSSTEVSSGSGGSSARHASRVGIAEFRCVWLFIAREGIQEERSTGVVIPSQRRTAVSCGCRSWALRVRRRGAPGPELRPRTAATRRRHVALRVSHFSLLSVRGLGVPSRRRSVCPRALPSEVGPLVGSAWGREGDATVR